MQIGLGRHFEPRDVHIGNLAANLMSLDSGVATVRDESDISNSPEHSDAAIAAHRESGNRAVFDHGRPSTEAEQWQFGSDRTHPADIQLLRNVLAECTWVSVSGGGAASHPAARRDGAARLRHDVHPPLYARLEKRREWISNQPA